MKQPLSGASRSTVTATVAGRVMYSTRAAVSARGRVTNPTLIQRLSMIMGFTSVVCIRARSCTSVVRMRCVNTAHCRWGLITRNPLEMGYCSTIRRTITCAMSLRKMPWQCPCCFILTRNCCIQASMPLMLHDRDLVEGSRLSQRPSSQQDPPRRRSHCMI